MKINQSRVHEGIKPYKCKYCDRKFGQKSNKNHHETTVHEGAKPYKCRYCKKHMDNLLTRHAMKEPTLA